MSTPRAVHKHIICFQGAHMARRPVHSLSTLLKYGDDVTTYQPRKRNHGGQDMERLSIQSLDRSLIRVRLDHYFLSFSWHT